MSDTSVPMSVPAVSLQLTLPEYTCICFVLGLVFLTVAKVGQPSYLLTYHPHKLVFVSLNSVLHLSIYYAWNGLRHKLYHFLRAALSKYYKLEVSEEAFIVSWLHRLDIWDWGTSRPVFLWTVGKGPFRSLSELLVFGLWQYNSSLYMELSICVPNFFLQ